MELDDKSLIIDIDNDPAWANFYKICQHRPDAASFFQTELRMFGVLIDKATVYFPSCEELARFRLTYG